MKRSGSEDAFQLIPSLAPVSGRVVIVDVGDEHVDPLRHSPSGVMERSSVEASILKRLLEFDLGLPVEQGEVAAVRASVAGLGKLLSEPRVAIGARTENGNVFVVEGPDGALSERQDLEEGEPIFGTPHEIIVLLPGVERAWLAVASDAPASREVVATLSTAASIIGRALGTSRACRVSRSVEDEMRLLNARIIQAEKLATLGELAAGMVHELNNPLTSIVAYTEYLERKWKSSGAGQDDLERLGRIGESASRMLRFTRDLVSYARVPSELPSPLSIHSVIDRALAFCEHVLAESKVVVRRAYMDGDPTLLGLSEPLAQVFVNLVTNACHAMPEAGGAILIVTSDQRDALVVAVHDSGSGIPEGDRLRVFEPFFTTKESGKGSGLGLSIVKNIVVRHGGTITVDSGDLEGARFTLVFPKHHREGSEPSG